MQSVLGVRAPKIYRFALRVCLHVCYLSIVGMIAGGGPLGGGGKPGGGTVMGNPTREEESINTLKTIRANTE